MNNTLRKNVLNMVSTCSFCTLLFLFLLNLFSSHTLHLNHHSLIFAWKKIESQPINRKNTSYSYFNKQIIGFQLNCPYSQVNTSSFCALLSSYFQKLFSSLCSDTPHLCHRHFLKDPWNGHSQLLSTGLPQFN